MIKYQTIFVSESINRQTNEQEYNETYFKPACFSFLGTMKVGAFQFRLHIQNIWCMLYYT